MIYDRIENIEKYKGISKWFDQAVDFLRKADLTSLPLGRNEICGSHVYANVMEVDSKKEEDIFFEFHKKYWDIHIDIEGVEKIQIGLEPGKVVEEYREDEDFGTLSNDHYMECSLDDQHFIVCMHEEAHKPTLQYNGCKRVKKCVIKVEVGEYEK